jgi:hypothetical protein
MAAFRGPRWWKRRSPEAKSNVRTATQFDDGEGQPSERDDDRHRKSTDGKRLIATRTATGEAWRRLHDVGQ